MSSPLAIRRFTGHDPELRAFLPDLARLRIQVFRDFPYLYDGTVEYEEKYLETYLRCPESIVVLVLDGENVVGATTGLPMDAETTEFQQPFLDAGYDPARIFYCAESVLLPAYRGRGVYPRFFAEREGHAESLGRFDLCCFCCVQRPEDQRLQYVDTTDGMTGTLRQILEPKTHSPDTYCPALNQAVSQKTCVDQY